MSMICLISLNVSTRRSRLYPNTQLWSPIEESAIAGQKTGTSLSTAARKIEFLSVIRDPISCKKSAIENCCCELESRISVTIASNLFSNVLKCCQPNKPCKFYLILSSLAQYPLPYLGLDHAPLRMLRSYHAPY